MAPFTSVSESDVRDMVLKAYGTSQVYDMAKLNEMMAKDGDIKMDSAPAAAIIAKIEMQLGRELPEPSDLRTDEFSSINSLVTLITRKLSEGEGKPLERTKVKATPPAGR